MRKRKSLIVLCLVGFIFSGCVSKNQYVELETKLTQTHAQLNDCDKQMVDLQTKYTRLQRENVEITNALEDLKLELRQEKMAVLEKEQEIENLEAIRRDIEATLQEQIVQKDQVISELDKTRNEIETSLKEQIAQKDIKIEEIEGKLKVTFVDKILFDSGSVKIKEKGEQVLLRLADTFKGNEDQKIVVEGHTDNVQIGKDLLVRFPSNWELSTARSAAVVRFLQEFGKIAPERLTASGFAYYQPVESNETEEGRAQNRRIEIILTPRR